MVQCGPCFSPGMRFPGHRVKGGPGRERRIVTGQWAMTEPGKADQLGLDPHPV
jgi:hypothetical protein